MYKRKEIIKNQKEFKNEIVDWLKKDFKEAKKDLTKIESKDKVIKKIKSELIFKFKKVDFDNQIEILFIHEKNIRPNIYAWWDDENQKVKILKYLDETR